MKSLLLSLRIVVVCSEDNIVLFWIKTLIFPTKKQKNRTLRVKYAVLHCLNSANATRLVLKPDAAGRH
jgi:hypothetical protein